MTNYIVIKKDGTEEEFDLDKILDAIKAAGASEIGAEIVVNKIVERLFKIKSSKLRRLVNTYLKFEAAKNFKKYYFKEHY
jgi:transcriptional regulator NrdR family protein